MDRNPKRTRNPTAAAEALKAKALDRRQVLQRQNPPYQLSLEPDDRVFYNDAYAALDAMNMRMSRTRNPPKAPTKPKAPTIPKAAGKTKAKKRLIFTAPVPAPVLAHVPVPAPVPVLARKMRECHRYMPGEPQGDCTCEKCCIKAEDEDDEY
jgi:hypothetical protein